jgi:hypothetical protein
VPAATRVIRQSRVMPAPIIEQTQVFDEPTIIKKIVEVRETTTPGAITETTVEGNRVGVETYVPRPIPVVARTQQPSCYCPWWLWPLLCLLLALAILGLFALSRNKGTASATKVDDNSNKMANNTEVERENITDVQT